MLITFVYAAAIVSFLIWYVWAYLGNKFLNKNVEKTLFLFWYLTLMLSAAQLAFFCVNN